MTMVALNDEEFRAEVLRLNRLVAASLRSARNAAGEINVTAVLSAVAIIIAEHLDALPSAEIQAVALAEFQEDLAAALAVDEDPQGPRPGDTIQ